MKLVSSCFKMQGFAAVLFFLSLTSVNAQIIGVRDAQVGDCIRLDRFKGDLESINKDFQQYIKVDVLESDKTGQFSMIVVNREDGSVRSKESPIKNLGDMEQFLEMSVERYSFANCPKNLDAVAETKNDDVWNLKCNKENLEKHFSVEKLKQKEDQLTINYYILSGVIREEVKDNFTTENSVTYYFDGENRYNSENVYICDQEKLVSIKTELARDSKNKLEKYKLFKEEIIKKYGAVSWERKILDHWTKKSSYYIESFGNNEKYSVVTLLTDSSFTLYRFDNSLKTLALASINQRKADEKNKKDKEIKGKINRI